MQSTTTTTTNTIFRNQSPPQSLQQPTLKSLDKLERLAVARLQHHVNELQLQVDNDRTLKPPVRKALQCICDETALTASIPDLKRFIAEKSITMLVPLSALDALDSLKKGTEDANIHAREAIRYFDRAQTSGTGRRAITGVKIQDPKDKFATWAECIAAAPAHQSPIDSSVSDLDDEPPARIKDVLNCAIYLIAKRTEAGNADDEDVFLVTNDENLKEWAEVFNVRCISSNEVLTRVKLEESEYQEKKRHYEYSVNPRVPTSPTATRGGRGIGGTNRGGRGGPISFGRNSSWRDDIPSHPMDPNGFGRGGRGYARDTGPEYVLRTPPRGVARGRGKLWEP